MTIGKLLKCIREEMGLSQEAFGERYGRSQRDVSFFETDRVVPSKEFLDAVAADTGDDVLTAYICGERDRDMIRWAVRNSVRSGTNVYA